MTNKKKCDKCNNTKGVHKAQCSHHYLCGDCYYECEECLGVQCNKCCNQCLGCDKCDTCCLCNTCGVCGIRHPSTFTSDCVCHDMICIKCAHKCTECEDYNCQENCPECDKCEVCCTCQECDECGDKTDDYTDADCECDHLCYGCTWECPECGEDAGDVCGEHADKCKKCGLCHGCCNNCELGCDKRSTYALDKCCRQCGYNISLCSSPHAGGVSFENLCRVCAVWCTGCRALTPWSGLKSMTQTKGVCDYWHQTVEVCPFCEPQIMKAIDKKLKITDLSNLVMSYLRVAEALGTPSRTIKRKKKRRKQTSKTPATKKQKIK